MLKGLFGTFAVWGVAMVGLRLTVGAPHDCGEIDMAVLRASASGAGAWLDRSQDADGSYVYEWNAEVDEFSSAYNAVRHAGVTMSLYQAAAETGDLALIPVADEGLRWMEENLIRRDDWAAIETPTTGLVKLGSSSLMLAGLGQRREATGDTQYDELMHELANFLVLMQLEEDGAFLNYWRPNTGEPDPGFRSRYATGEAFWALAQMHGHFPGEGWDEPVIAVAEYLSLHRDEVEGLDFPPWADQWASYGLAEMANVGIPLTEENVTYARSLAERFGFLIRVESQRTDGQISKWFRGQKTRAAGMGTWVEGTTSLWRLAGMEPRLADTRDALGERAVCGAALLANRQYDAADSEGTPRPELVEGAWFRDDATRMDDQQHALSGLVRTEVILEEMLAHE